MYFNIEHFLSDLIIKFEIPRTDTRNKQALLKDVLAYFSIEDKLILSDVTQSILDRCNESNEILLTPRHLSSHSSKKSFSIA
jgi:hypothetical protein